MAGKKIKINLDYLRPNNTFIYPLCTESGEIILEARAVLTEKKIRDIKDRYGTNVFYTDTGEKPVIPAYRVKAAYNKAREIMDEIFSTEKLSRTSYRNAETVIEEIIGDLSSTEVDALNLMKDIRSHEEYLYTHSVNTGIITALFAAKCGKYSQDEVKYVSLGAYLHDIGSTKIDKQLLNKKGKLDISEVQKVKRHPQLGYEILKGIDRISPIVLQSVLFHHEKYNNRGYYQLPYETLPEFPKMVSIADIYDAMTSDRPYRKATTPGYALKAIVNCINSHFDYDLISGFVNMLGPVLNQAQSFYRTGDICELNTQELAVIRDLGDRDLLRPKVWVFCKFVRQGNRLTVNYYRSPSLVSLQSDPARHITKIISDENQIATIKQKLDERKVL